MPIKITDLTVATPPLALGDFAVIVDISDTTQAASGSTRKITLQTLLQAFGLVGVPMTSPVDTDLLPYYDGAAPTTPKTITVAELNHLLGSTNTISAAAVGRLRSQPRLRGRPVAAARNDAGREFSYGAADWSVYKAFLGPQAGTTLQTFGCAATSVGTISHPAATQVTGHMSNHVTGGAAGNTAGTSDSVAKFFRGDGTGVAAGFFFAGRIYLPDASYDQSGATTGSRIFAGMTSVALSEVVASDNPAGDHCGFARNHSDAGLQHANWQIQTRDGATITFTDTGVPFTPQNVYDVFLWQPPASGTVYWSIENITGGGGGVVSGSVSATLPTTNTLLRFGMQVQSVNAVARNIREQHLYCESDV